MPNELDALFSNQATITSTAESSVTASLRSRYQDAYRVAGFVVAIGAVVKVVAFVAGGVLLLGAMIAGGNLPDNSFEALSPSALVVLGLVIIAAIAWLLIFALGVLISAQGQLLRATLDGTVNSSPFLENADRAAIMGI